MTEEQATLALIKGAIFDLPAADQERVKACADHIRTAVDASGPAGLLALALVGAEAALAA